MIFDVAMTLPTGLPRFPGAFTGGVAILTACQSAVVFRVYPQGGEPVESKSYAILRVKAAVKTDQSANQQPRLKMPLEITLHRSPFPRFVSSRRFEMATI